MGLLLALALTLLAPFASSNLDGLESVAERLGFAGQAQAAPFEILPNYSLPVLGQSGLSTILAGVIGVLVVFTAVWVVARLARGR
jgi:cobalt/nickel transport system permease protein